MSESMAAAANVTSEPNVRNDSVSRILVGSKNMSSTTSSISNKVEVDFGVTILHHYKRSDHRLPNIVLARGSVVNFRVPKSRWKVGAIVNAANESCVGGGGVDGAITEAGGIRLAQARLALPIWQYDSSSGTYQLQTSINRTNDNQSDSNDSGLDDPFSSDSHNDAFPKDSRTQDDVSSQSPFNRNKHQTMSSSKSRSRVRCPTGSAVLTGPDQFGSIHVPYVIHAVGPNYFLFSDHIRRAHQLLYETYQQALTLAVSQPTKRQPTDTTGESPITHIAFPLLSSGIYRGSVPLRTVLHIAVLALKEWEPPQQAFQHPSIQEIFICAYTAQECTILEDICNKELLL